MAPAVQVAVGAVTIDGLVEILPISGWFEGAGGIIDLTAIPGVISESQLSAMSKPQQKEYLTKILLEAYSTEEKRRTPGQVKLAAKADLVLAEMIAKEANKAINGQILAPGKIRAYGGTLSLVRTATIVTVKVKNGEASLAKGAKIVWTGPGVDTNFTDKVSQNNLKPWYGK